MLSAHQPCYLPWLGLFDKILRSDTFVILDQVQFATGKDNYVNRNRIKGPSGAEWMTVPVSMAGHTTKTIADMPVHAPWREQHLERIRRLYAPAPYVHLADGLLPPEAPCLADVAGMSLVMLVGMLLPECVSRLKTQSGLGLPPAHKTQLIADLCHATGERSFLFGGHGKDYADLDILRGARIEPVFQEYAHPSYPQLWGGWIPNLSVVDAILNVGVAETSAMIRRFVRNTA
jgi:hypothetical protein